MRKNDNGWALLGLIAIVLIIIEPVIYYFCGWISGHILKFFIGDTIINGLNYLFNTTRFTTDMLPITCGTLGVVGSFFKSTTSSSKD